MFLSSLILQYIFSVKKVPFLYMNCFVNQVVQTECKKLE